MLTPRQERFIEQYLIDLNATQAAIRAGYSEKTANQQGPRLLEMPEIREAIDAAKSHRSEVTQITSQRVLEEIASVAFYDPAEIMVEIARVNRGEGHDHGLRGPTDIRNLPEHIRRVITGWTWDRSGNFTVKIADKLRALDQLARHLSLYNDRIEVATFDGLADRLDRANRALGTPPDYITARAVAPPHDFLANEPARTQRGSLAGCRRKADTDQSATCSACAACAAFTPN